MEMKTNLKIIISLTNSSIPSTTVCVCQSMNGLKIPPIIHPILAANTKISPPLILKLKLNTNVFQKKKILKKLVKKNKPN